MTRRPLLLGVALALSCRDRVPAPPPAPRGLPEAIVFARHFQGFRSWERIDLPAGGELGLTHVAGVRRVFVNRRPAAEATAFPVGTILVKEVLAGKPDHRLFAMVKRGGDYNAQGARGWEWFEIRERTDGAIGIAWRGINAPAGEIYGGDPNGACNGCHTSGSDFVRTPGLHLAGR